MSSCATGGEEIKSLLFASIWDFYFMYVCVCVISALRYLNKIWICSRKTCSQVTCKKHLLFQQNILGVPMISVLGSTGILWKHNITSFFREEHGTGGSENARVFREKIIGKWSVGNHWRLQSKLLEAEWLSTAVPSCWFTCRTLAKNSVSLTDRRCVYFLQQFVLAPSIYAFPWGA